MSPVSRRLYLWAICVDSDRTDLDLAQANDITSWSIAILTSSWKYLSTFFLSMNCTFSRLSRRVSHSPLRPRCVRTNIHKWKLIHLGNFPRRAEAPGIRLITEISRYISQFVIIERQARRLIKQSTLINNNLICVMSAPAHLHLLTKSIMIYRFATGK